MICVSEKTIKYIITFMFGNVNQVTYSSEPLNKLAQPIVIRPSFFFEKGVYGTGKTVPGLPLKTWHGIPLLFGESTEQWIGEKLVVNADIIASSFFLISRYEETVNLARDSYGRIIGKESLPYKAEFMHRPIVEEYAAAIACIANQHGIKIDLPHNGFADIYFTHDVDVPWEYFSFKTAVKRTGGILKRHRRLDFFPIKNWMGRPESDPRYTFSELILMDSQVKGSTSVYFFKSGGTLKPQDGFVYIRTTAAKRLINKVRKYGALIGYHSSFSAGQDTSLIKTELETLRGVADMEIKIQRNHYLCSKEPKDFHVLIENGITEDFTMGYADVAGFRLGTCRAVKWIDPYTGELTDLLLHPLIIMECSLNGPNYMNLEFGEMKKYSFGLIDSAYRYGGEISFLWHNQSIMEGDIQREMYKEIIEYMKTKTSAKSYRYGTL